MRQNIALLDFQDVERQLLGPVYKVALLSTTKKDPTTETITDPLVGTFMVKEEAFAIE
jgi:hypothetical protein